LGDEELTLDRRLLGRAAVGLLVVLSAAAVAGVWLREPITAFSSALIDRVGWAGVFVGVLITDTSPLPLTHEPVLLMAVADGLNVWAIGGVAATASVVAGPLGYLGGRLLGRSAHIEAWLLRRSPGMVGFLRRWGATGVAIAALLPIPYALATWTAGLAEVRFLHLCAASLLRIPKTLFYLWLIVQGWSLTA